MTSSRNLLFLSTESNKTDEPFRVEEAETVNVPPPPTEKVHNVSSLSWTEPQLLAF